MFYEEGSYGDLSAPFAGLLSGDAAEAAKMQAFAPSPAGTATPWWQNVVQYGITRAIDNRYGPPVGIQGQTTTGSFAGQNGQSYYQVPNGQARATYGPGVAQPVRSGMDGNMLLLIGAGVAAFLLLRK